MITSRLMAAPRLAQCALHAIGYAVEVHPSEPAAMPARVTVVIPCYNYGDFLEGCLDSALSQRGVDVDVVIVDDASPDGSGAVADRLAAADRRVRTIRHATNLGHIATYRDGLCAASGEFVTLLSADDLLAPGALERAVALMLARPNVGFVYGPAVHFADAAGPGRDTAGVWVVWPGHEWLAVRARAGYNCIASPEVVMRTSVLRRVGGYRADLPHTADLELWLRAARVSDVGYIHGADQAFYRQHASNMHKSQFRSGSAEGEVIDLEHRLRAFETVFAADVEAEFPPAARLRGIARCTLAREALQRVNHAYARGFRDAPVVEFVDFAQKVDPAVLQGPAGRAVRRRRQLGMLPVPLHPLWAPREVLRRVVRRVRLLRLRELGV